MFYQLRFSEAVKFVGQDQPFVTSIKIIVGYPRGFPIGRLVVRGRYAKGSRHVSLQSGVKSINNSFYVESGTKDIIDDQQAVIVIQALKQVLSTVYADSVVRVADHTGVCGCALV